MHEVEPHRGSTVEEELRDLYLTLLRDAILHTLYRPIDSERWPSRVTEPMKDALRDSVKGEARLELYKPYDPLERRRKGQDLPTYGQTTIGIARMDNVRRCVEQCLAAETPGDLIEAGVWRGGVPIFMRGILRSHGVRDRSVVVADSFRGLPPADPGAYPADKIFEPEEVGRFAVTRAEVEQNFENYGLLDEQVEFVEGWFRETLPSLRGRSWALIRLDGDLYESTIDCLENLYPQLAPGGFVIIDDYVFEPCRAAVEDYRAREGIIEEIVQIDWTGAFWQRSP